MSHSVAAFSPKLLALQDVLDAGYFYTCSSVCVLFTQVSLAKMAEPIKIPFEE